MHGPFFIAFSVKKNEWAWKMIDTVGNSMTPLVRYESGCIEHGPCSLLIYLVKVVILDSYVRSQEGDPIVDFV